MSEQISISWKEAERYDKLHREIVLALKLKSEADSVLKEGVNI